ncbi:alpha/beta hydrolase [Actinomycetota bacterium]
MSLRPPRILAATVAAVLALSGCSLFGDDPVVGGGAAAGDDPSAHTAPAGQESLAKFYEQRLEWSNCAGKAQCAKLTVPVDYAKPDGETIELSLLRVPSTSKNRRIGALVVNPGGPGGSGVDYAAAADFIVGAPVRSRFDVVGFDPRGVGRSAPVDCVDDKALDGFLGGEATPDTPEEEQQFADQAKSFAQGCGERSAKLIGHVSTVDAAKDMDVLRAALGQPKLHYLGKSYGTYLGATYADLFPATVGRFVLDGVLPPDLTGQELGEGQAKGFELATRAWAKDCAESGDCPLGTSEDAVVTGLQELLKRLDANPVPAKVGSSTIQVTEGWASTGIAAAMYDQGQWGILTDALKDVVRKDDGSALMGLANSYAERDPSGRYSGNIMEVIYAVNCLDKPENMTIEQYRAAAVEMEKVSPTWGTFMAWSSIPCNYWPVKPDTKPKVITAEGADPIVVVGTTRDPATPYEWSVRLRKELKNAALITYDGDGHTAYTRSNACVDSPINDFYVKGKVPQDGLRC